MAQYKVGIVVGSLRKDSFNRRLANALIKLAPPEFSCKLLEIGDLPLYNQDDDADPADTVKKFKSEIKSMQGLLFCTPEYNRSIPGVLKNAVDHASRPYGQSVLTGKPTGILGISAGPMGTIVAQQHLRIILSCLDVPMLMQPEVYLQYTDGFFDEAGNLSAKEFLQKWMDKYVVFVKKHATQ